MKDDKILKITDDVEWIGVLDPDIRTFDIVMETKYGATYNSFFINAEKKAVVETTKEKFWDVYLEKLRRVVDPAEIEYIIMNHTEPDHSGNAIRLMKIAPKAKIVGTGNVIRYMADLMNMDFPHIVVKDGDMLDLGNKKVRFIGAPNLHWPDSMYSYLLEDKVLFTCDSFGSHYCHEEMYDDRVGNFDDAFKYYYDVILKPFSKYMLKAIEKIRPLEIKAICTGHGPLLINNWKRYVDLSEQYAKEALTYPKYGRVLIGYVSAYGKTKILAESIAEGVSQVEGVEADLCDIETMPAGVLAEKLAEASGIIIGSCTINQNTLPQIFTMFALMSPLRDKGKPAGCFGSYGWSGEAQKIIEANLSALKLQVFADNIFIKFTPSAGDIARCREYGKNFAARVLEMKCSG
ncbi:MAG TPA: FprA family A-type flavoprotein [Bacteroidales bacterium]|nr:FprA family A-type flavoprotein [Bacteroidales bacterium]